MGYRKHLKIISKSNFEKAIENEKKWFNFIYETGKFKSIEISDSTDLRQFKKIKSLKHLEYPPYILTKKDLLKIINFYKEQQLSIAKDKLAQFDRIKEKGSLQVDSDISLFMNSYFILLINVESYFKKVDDKYLVNDSDYFLLQYFYLVELYKTVDFKKDVLVITHG